jgi:hypothetical protein
MSFLGDTVKYTCEVILTTAHGTEAPPMLEFQHIVDMALKDALNNPTTPYYVIHTVCTEVTGDIE